MEVSFVQMLMWKCLEMLILMVMHVVFVKDLKADKARASLLTDGVNSSSFW